MTDTDPIMASIGEGIELGQRGERAAARELFTKLWHEIGADGDPLHRCALAHSMADVQDDVRDELAWDDRALRAAELVTEENLRRAGMSGPVSGIYPSLHLNLGDDYRRLGEIGAARSHLERGLAFADSLPEDGYGQLVRSGLRRLAGRLQAT